MNAQAYTLTVKSQIEERQLRRLGAAVALLWRSIPPETRDDLLKQAAMIHISGETTSADDIRAGILSLVASGVKPF
jgi:hypothetical protein